MLTNNKARQLALAYDEAVELPHFEKASFRVNKKIFMTLDETKSLAMVKLSEVDQDIFTKAGNGAVYPVPGGWGKGGATYVELHKVDEELFKDALNLSYCSVAPKKLAEKYRAE